MRDDHFFIDYYRQCGRAELDAVLFDVDGTLASGRKPLPHASELLTQMKADGFPYFLLTNDSCTSPAVKSERLRSIGIPVDEHEIVSCAHTLKTFVVEQGWQQLFFFVNGVLGEPSYAELAGLKWTDDPSRIDETDAIIFGEGEYEWKRPLETVFNHLIAQPETPCVVPNPDSYWPLATGHGELGVGAGGQARFIFQLLSEKGIAVKPYYLGKPYPMIYRHTSHVLEKVLGRQPEMGRIGMIGDSLKSDICGGNRAGMRTILVLSGITAAQQLCDLPEELKPKMVFDSL